MSVDALERGDPAVPGDDAAPPLSRMAIAVLSLAGVLVSAYLALYRWGYLAEIQCSIGGCDTVQASPYALFLGVPVAAWGVIAYAVLLVVALAGLRPRWVGARWVSLVLFAVSATGVAFSAYLTYLEALVIHTWCQWCVISAILVTLIFLLSLPGLRRAR